jgi:hypothetical protein
MQGAGLYGLLEPVIGAGLRREMKAALPALKALLEKPSRAAAPRSGEPLAYSDPRESVS